MIKSMTGFGAAVTETDALTVKAEIKSLNSKHIEATIRLPRTFADKEIEVRNLLSHALERGKINLYVEWQHKAETKAGASINKQLVATYYNELLETALLLRAETTDLLKIALQMPDALVHTSSLDPEADQLLKNEWPIVLQTIQQALDSCNQFRADEGLVLQNTLTESIEKIRHLLAEVEKNDPQRIAAIRQRLHDRIQELAHIERLDENRFEQELIYYIEKLDINEEKVRLRSHLDYFMETMLNEEGNGKKLGFIAQEIGREINTIGSKVSDAQIQRFVVEMKEELEKIKEQNMNVL